MVDLPRLYDLGFTIAMILTGWGEALGLYDLWKPYDNVVHVIVPMLCCQVAYIALARIEVLPDLRDDFVPRHYAGIFTVAFSLGVAIGGVWEIVEWTSDAVLRLEPLDGERRHRRAISCRTRSARRWAACCSSRGPSTAGAQYARIPGHSRREDVDADESQRRPTASTRGARPSRTRSAIR